MRPNYKIEDLPCALTIQHRMDQLNAEAEAGYRRGDRLALLALVVLLLVLGVLVWWG